LHRRALPRLTLPHLRRVIVLPRLRVVGWLGLPLGGRVITRCVVGWLSLPLGRRVVTIILPRRAVGRDGLALRVGARITRCSEALPATAVGGSGAGPRRPCVLEAILHRRLHRASIAAPGIDIARRRPAHVAVVVPGTDTCPL
jgi:hypothetical protein